MALRADRDEPHPLIDPIKNGAARFNTVRTYQNLTLRRTP